MFSKIDKEDKKIIIINFILSRMVLYCIIYILRNFDFIDLYDCEHYMDIATEGYTKAYQYAFFPLIPLIIRFLSPLGLLIINNLATFVSAFLFLYISKYILNTKNPQITVLLWLWSPIAIFTTIYYTESLFVFFTLIAFYFYKEKKFLLSGITLGLSVATRSTGSILFFALFICMFINFLKKKESFKNIAKMYIPATIISCLYPIYLQIVAGNWKIFVDVQYINWQKEKNSIFTLISKIKYIMEVENAPSRMLYYMDFFIVLGIMAVIIICCIAKFKDKKYTEIIVYAILSIIMISSTCKTYNCPTISYYRYLCACFSFILLMPQNKIILAIFKFFCIIVSFGVLCHIWFF